MTVGKFIFLTIFSFVAFNSNAAVVTHYAIDFSSPLHTVGIGPTIGNTSDTVSSYSGNPVVVSSFGSLSDQPLFFAADTTGWDQIQLILGLGYDNYHVSFDIETNNLVDSNYLFAIFFDTPSVQTLYFHGGVGVKTFHAASGLSSTGGIRGTFSDNDLMHVDIDIDLQGTYSFWSVNIGSVLTFNELFYAPDNDVNSIRLGLNEWVFKSALDPNVTVALDNIVVSSVVVPTPASVWLFGSGLFGLVGIARSRRKSPPATRRQQQIQQG